MSGRAAFLLSAAAMLLLPAILNRPITVFLMVERTWGKEAIGVLLFGVNLQEKMYHLAPISII